MNCIVCRKPMHASWSPATFFQRDWVCPECENQLTPLGTGCPACGQPNDTGGVCSDCIRWSALGLDLSVRSLFAYDEQGINWLHRFKFGGDVVLVEQVRSTLRYLRERGTTYVPIPLSEERLRSRRFNQAEYLARMIGPTQNLLLKEEVLSQREFGKERRRHRSNPFTVQKQVKCGKIVLVDDVYTTGTTLHQAVFALHQAGYKEVSAICLFRALNKSKTRPI